MIKADVVAHSKHPETGKEIVTLNVTYGLYIHAEMLRHRLISRSVKSNRAIPSKIIRKEVRKSPYTPVFMGKNKKGMQSKEEIKFPNLARFLWKQARYPALAAHWAGERLLGGHKEWLNRLLMPWQWVTETITATEWDNLFNLRLHEDAQRDIKEIVEKIYWAIKESEPVTRRNHVPYVTWNEIENHPIEDCFKFSCARCARSSYNNHDKSNPDPEKDKNLYSKLLESDPMHASPAEHQAFADINKNYQSLVMRDKYNRLVSGNLFGGWIQYRETLGNHTCWEFKG